MSQVVEIIPDFIVAEAEAARAWFAREQDSEFNLTGIVDPDESLESNGAILVANGWFLKPVLFGHRPEGPTVATRQRNAMIRLVLFIAAWVAALVYAPIWMVAAAFAGWVAKITPGVRMVNRLFQNVGPDEEPT